MDKQARAFISYSKVNKDFAVRLATELKARGFFVWLDELDIPFDARARWDDEVEEALIESRIFMPIITPSSLASEHIRDEIGYAIDSGHVFLPILLEHATVPLRLRRFAYVDFTNQSFDDGVEETIARLEGLIETGTVRRDSLRGTGDAMEIMARPEAVTSKVELKKTAAEAAGPRIFISYSRANKGYVLKLANELKADGFLIWLDQLDIPPGAAWDNVVEKALTACDFVMVIMTSASIASENVKDEIGYAFKHGKRFIPVMLEKCDVPMRLHRLQYVDVSDKDFADGVRSIKELLRSSIA